MFVFLCYEGKQRPSCPRSGVELHGPQLQEELAGARTWIVCDSETCCPSGGLQIPFPTCSWLWVSELAVRCLHPSPRWLCSRYHSSPRSWLLHSYRISWEGATTDLPLRRVLLNLRCDVSEGLHVSTPDITDYVLTSAPSFPCFLPFFFLAPCKLAAVVYGWGLCMALLMLLSALKK